MQDKVTRKWAVNLTVDAELLAEARDAGTNLSALLERALRDELAERRRQRWREENKAAIAASNRQMQEDGPWYTPRWASE